MEFKDLNIITPILDSLNAQGYREPTPIQEQTIPLLLEGHDVIGIAQTGTGKTAAFTIPLLQKLSSEPGNSKNPRALILAPTRELAAQISDSLKTYGRFLGLRHLAVYGGVGIQPQIKTLSRGIDILIATPGRLMDLMNQRKVNLESVDLLVLDEADRMLDMGFLNDIKKIVSSLSRERQSLFFSATMSNSIKELTADFLKNPKSVEIIPESTSVERIEQLVFYVDQDDKSKLLLDIIRDEKPPKTIIFVGMKYKADRIVRTLASQNIRADSIHGNKTQFQRTRALRNFKTGKVSVLIATDIAARGIDVDNITHVINYDLPNEPENYIHRIGRTARAGSKGIAYSFCSAEDKNFLNQIERLTKKRIVQCEHKYHSVTAKSAKGVDAKPKRRGDSRGRGRTGGSYGSSRGGPSRSKYSEGRSDRRKSSSGDSRGPRSGGRGRSPSVGSPRSGSGARRTGSSGSSQRSSGDSRRSSGPRSGSFGNRGRK